MKFFLKQWLLIWLGGCSLLAGGKAFAQEEKPVQKPYSIGLSQLGGFIVAHSPRMKHLANTHPMGLELNLQQQTTGQEEWHQLYKFPKVGLSLIWFDYHSPVMGHSFAASTYINKSFFRTKKQEINFRIGTGLAYFTNKFDLRENHKNTIVSSAFNAVLQTRFEYDLKLSEHLAFMASIGLNHYSNGATTKPNLGINIPTLSLALNYHSNRNFVPVPQELAEFQPRNYLLVSSSIGYKQFSESSPKKYLVNSVSVLAARQVNRKSMLVAGLEGFYDRSLLEQQKFDSTLNENEPFPDVKKAGLTFGHELLLGKISFVTHLGLYIYRPYKWDTFYYERLGLKYQFTRHVWGAVDLKIHRGAADVIEWKLGLRI